MSTMKQILWAFVAWGAEDLYDLQHEVESSEIQRELEEVFLSVAECLPVYHLLGRKQQLLNWLQHEPVVVVEPVPEPALDTRHVRLREPIPSSLSQQATLLAPQLDRRLRSTPRTDKGVPVVTGPQGERSIYILHLFSGRRRDGDCHYWFHALIHDYLPHHEVKVFSVDTAIHDQCGNLASGRNYELLWNLACRGFFALCISGPPCETWSAARHLQLEGVKFAPRPLRSFDKPWGLDGRSLRELHQLTMGSELMVNHLQLETAVVLQGGGSLMEHPAPPRPAEYASIWRVPLHSNVSMEMRHSKQIVIEQWRYGAVGVKPTTIRCQNLGERVGAVLHQCTVDGLTRPQNSLMGLDEAQCFKTAAAKEYPSGLCLALVRASLDGLQRRIKVEGCCERNFDQLSLPEQEWVATMESAGLHVFAPTFLPDYQPNRG